MSVAFGLRRQGTAFLYASPSGQVGLFPLVPSHFFRLSLHERFFMQGGVVGAHGLGGGVGCVLQRSRARLLQ